MAALKDDNINLHINIGVSEAVANIQKLSDANRQLASENKEARTRMAELNAQGEKNSEEYKQLAANIKVNNAAIKENNKNISEQEKNLELNEKTMTQLRKEAKELQTQLDRTVQSADPAGYADLQKRLEAVKGRMAELRTTGQSLSTQLQAIPGPAGAVAKSVVGIHKAALTFIANPLFAVLAAVVGVFVALYKAISTSEEATNKLNAIMAPLGAIMDAFLNVVQKCVGAILDFISTIMNGLMKVLEKIPFLGKYFKQLNDFSSEAIELEKAKQALEKKERDTLEENAKAEMKISKLRTSAKQKDAYIAKERVAMLQEANKLAQQIADKEHAIAMEQLRIAEAEAARADNATEKERKLSELRAATSAAEKKYSDRSRELTEQLNTAKNEILAEEKKKKEDALKKQLEAVDHAIAKEKAALLQARLDKEISEQELQKKLENLELESLNRKLDIKGLDKKKQDEINQAILNAKVKFLQEEEKLNEELRRDALSKQEKELDDIRKKYDARQKLLIESKEKGIITELEYTNRLNTQQNELQAELDKKREEQAAATASEAITKKDEAFQQEKIRLLERYADNQITQEEYQNSLLELEQQYLDEKLRINGLSEEQITKLKEQQLNARIAISDKAHQKEKKQLEQRSKMFLDFAGNVGTILGETLTDTEKSIADALGEILLLALDTLRQYATIAIAETTIRNIKEVGIIGLAKAAAEIALINAAFATVKGIIQKPNSKNAKGDTDNNDKRGRYVVNQHAAGKYDVIGNEDGRLYKDVPYIGSPETGIVKSPALIAERGEELIISSPDLQLLKKHPIFPYFVSAIGNIRNTPVPQHAEGDYSHIDTDLQSGDPKFYQVLLQIEALLIDLKENGVGAYVGLDTLDAQRKLRDDSRSIGTLKKS